MLKSYPQLGYHQNSKYLFSSGLFVATAATATVVAVAAAAAACITH